MEKEKPKDKDSASKIFFLKNERFADLMNGSLYDGQQIIHCDELSECDTELNRKIEGLSVVRRRDLIKRFRNHILGVEFQSTVDNAMALRTMMYDALTYERVLDTNKVLCPVTTLCLYTGIKSWEKAKSLHDMMDGLTQVNVGVVADYPLHLVSLIDADIDLFHNRDVRELITLFQLVHRIESVQELEQEIEKLEIESEDAIYTAGILADTDLLQKCLVRKEGGEFKVCENLKRIFRNELLKEYPWLANGYTEEKTKRIKAETRCSEFETMCSEEKEKRIEAEKETSFMKNKLVAIAKKMLKQNEPIESIMEITGLSPSEIHELMVTEGD